MLIETCNFLRPSIKAKLQEAGILYVDELISLVSKYKNGGGTAKSSSEIENQTKDHDRQASAKAMQLKSRGKTPYGEDPWLQSGASSVQALGTDLAFLTESERTDVVCSTLGYCNMRNVETAAKRSDEGECEVGQDDLDDVFDSHPSLPPRIRSLAEVLQDETRRRQEGIPQHVTTFSRRLDALLGGGVPVGSVTEFSGPPGAGKTQLLLQLAVSCALPIEFGGLNGRCLFIDTEGSFVRDRFCQIALAAIALVREIGASMPKGRRGATSAQMKAGATNGGLANPLPVSSSSFAGTVPQPNPSNAARLLKRTREWGGETATNPTHWETEKYTCGDRKQQNRQQRRRRSETPKGSQTPPLTPNEGSFKGGPIANAPVSSSHAGKDQQACPSVPRRILADPFPREVNDNPQPQPVQHLPPAESTAFASAAAPLQKAGVGAGKPHFLRSVGEQFTLSGVLERVFYLHAMDATTFMAVIYALPQWVREEQLSMVLIDSIASPFRGAELAALNNDDEKEEEEEAQAGPEMGLPQPFRAAQGEMGLPPWQRSRLLFTCGERLQACAARYHLAVVVTNHLTSRTMRVWVASGRGDEDEDEIRGTNERGPAARTTLQTVLIPSLGDAWGCQPTTRVLLSHHHYKLPLHPQGFCAVPEEGKNNREPENGAPSSSRFRLCPEDTVLDYSSHKPRYVAAGDSLPAAVQHRVARILKSPTYQCAEACFVISRKGIRDGNST